MTRQIRYIDYWLAAPIIFMMYTGKYGMTLIE